MKFASSWLSPLVLGPCFMAAGLLLWTGCNGSQRSTAKRPPSERAAQREARGLFNSIRSQLRRLPEASQLELTPPTVLLDRRSTSDGEEIQAVLVRRPGVIDGPANLFVVKRGDVHFRGVVEPGDIVKFYADYDRETQARLKEAGDIGIPTFQSTDFRVAQVFSDDSLLIEGGIATEYDVLRRLEVWRIADDRMDEITRQWSAYVSRREPPLDWQPSPDQSSLNQLTERLNQWLRQSGLSGSRAEAADWERPQLLSTLPESLAADDQIKPFLTDKELSTGNFRTLDSRLIEGALWRSGVARWARGSNTSPVAIAASLFDWTVRNVQLVSPANLPPRWPWEMMLHGQATAAGRAWVFAGLCEQQNLTTAIVTIPAGAEGGAERTLVGVLDGEQLHLFDPVLGAPLPGASNSTPQSSVATLAQIQAGDTLLRTLDLEGRAYPVTADQAKQARVAVVATPFALTRRASALSSKLTAEDSVALAVDVDAAAERLGKAEGVGEVTLWAAPFELLRDKFEAKPSERRQAVRDFLPFAWRPILWRGRAQHFRGVKEDEDASRSVLDEALDDHKAALRYYMNRRVRPPDAAIDGQPKEKRDIYRAAKSSATLFLGTLCYDQGSYDVSKGWLENSALENPAAEAIRPAVRYNLARALEELGELERSAEVLESIEGPMADGAKLRARALRQAAAETASDAEAPADDATTGDSDP